MNLEDIELELFMLVQRIKLLEQLYRQDYKLQGYFIELGITIENLQAHLKDIINEH